MEADQSENAEVLESFETKGDSFIVRKLRSDDFHKGFYDVLAQLTEVGSVNEEQFQARFAELNAVPDTYHVIVIEDVGLHQIAATARVFIEKKFTRNCGQVGHVEDVVVDTKYRQRGLGLKLLDNLTKICEAAPCYKIILDCNDGNVKFYETCGYERKEVQMARYLRRP